MSTEDLLTRMVDLAKSEIPDLSHWLRPIRVVNDELATEHGHGLFHVFDDCAIGDPKVSDGTTTKSSRFYAYEGEEADVVRRLFVIWESKTEGGEDEKLDGRTTDEMRAYFLRAIEEWRFALDELSPSGSSAKSKQPRFKTPPCPRCSKKCKVKAKRDAYRQIECTECDHEWNVPS